MKRRLLGAFVGFATFVVVGACTSGQSNQANELVGTASAAIDLAPTNALCIQIQVTGTTTVTRTLDVSPLTSTTFFLDGLPLGEDTFSASAYGSTCVDGGPPSSAPTWLGNPVAATVVASPPVNVTLQMHPTADAGLDAGSALIGLNFPAPNAGCAPVITEYTVPSSAAPLNGPYHLTVGPDGNIWFGNDSGGDIDSLTTTGAAFQQFPAAPDGGRSDPQFITLGPDGKLWFTDTSDSSIGVFSPSTGSVTEFAAGIPAYAITAGPDGNLWFVTESGVGLISPTGGASSIQLFTEPASDAGSPGPARLTSGSDGNVWFTDATRDVLYSISPTGGAASIRSFAMPFTPVGITSGPDGDLWFVGSSGSTGYVGTMNPSTGPASLRTFAVPSAGAGPIEIASGPDGNLWFTERTTNKIGVISPTGGSLREFPILAGSAYPTAIILGPDGNLWFTEANAAIYEGGLGEGRVANITPYAVCPDAGAVTTPVTVSPDGGASTRIGFALESGPTGDAE